MAIRSPMRNLFQRFRKNRRLSQEEVDLTSLAPMVHLMGDAEPDPQLFSRIEAIIDQETSTPSQSDKLTMRGGKTVLLALVVGLAVGALVASLLESRQKITAQPSLSGPWIPLGSVTLRGEALRSFVRSKCVGQTHFFITMHGFHDKRVNENNDEAPLLMAEGEKILMECIF